MKWIYYILVMAVTISPISIEAKSLTQSERDRYYREANLAILKYYQCLDEADTLANEFKDDLKNAVWGVAMDACTVISMNPGTAREKGLTILSFLMTEFRKSEYFGGLSGKAKEKAKCIDTLIAEAAGWHETYVKSRDALITNEHPKVSRGGMFERFKIAQSHMNSFKNCVEAITESIESHFYWDLDSETEPRRSKFYDLILILEMAEFNPCRAKEALEEIRKDCDYFIDMRSFCCDYWGFNAAEYDEWRDEIKELCDKAEIALMNYCETLGISYE